MRFLIAVMDNQSAMATPSEMAAIDAFNSRLEASGHWVMAAGIEAPIDSLVIDGRGTAAVVTRGSSTATAEYMSGFWIIEAASREAAQALAIEGSQACNRRVELRAFL